MKNVENRISNHGLAKGCNEMFEPWVNVGTRWHNIPESSSVILLLFELFICLHKK
jgi:hypothetical protein